MNPADAQLSIDALHDRLRARLLEVRPPVVADVMRAFLEVSSSRCDRRLWSLEFAFDESDGRVAGMEARFVEWSEPAPTSTALPGFGVQLLLPRLIPAAQHANGETAVARKLAVSVAERSIVARFLRALADLGAYRTIETLEAISVEVELL